ncbi:MAG: 50S ribosomal protein L13 [Nanoarchaeota archaeon]|nr:50S ribosomal protein L13 [Nanoarchaeota archaeon]
MEKKIYDGENAIFGRVATVVAKELLKGNIVYLINCEKILISGDKSEFVKKMQAKLKMGRGASMKGPKYSRRADFIVKRMVRGMLPWDRTRGREAYKRFKCFVGSGDLEESDLKKAEKITCRVPYKFFNVEKLVRALR